MIEKVNHIRVITFGDTSLFMTLTESVALAQMRTLLAIERNYLAEERTSLAEFRTGLALTLIGPPSGIALLPSLVNDKITNWMLGILYTFVVLATSWGIYMVINSTKKVRKIRKDKKIIHQKEAKLMEQSKEVRDLLFDCMMDETYRK